MKLFKLNRIAATLVHKNDRNENDGEDKVLALDLDWEIQVPNDFLEQFGEGMKAMFYKRPDNPDLADDENHMPLLRAECLGKQEVARDWVNCRLTIHQEGLMEDHDIELHDVKIKKVRFVAMHGGTVKVRFQSQFRPDPDEPEIIGGFSLMIGKTGLLISLWRPLDDEAPLTNDETPNPVEAAAREQEQEAAPSRGRGRAAAVH